ncbi:MAG: tRNA pseudouridine(55) synthase TruB [Pseudomonadota bacterium]
MARRRRGRPIHGWLIIDKPAGKTSADVVAIVRKTLDAQKAGHAGTLDPAATGLLAVALGEATKTVPWLTDARKTYEFRIRFGQATDTDDAEGTVIAESDARPTEDEIRAALPRLTGEIEQVPPQVSAVHVDGVRAYARVRAGETVELAPRKLVVHRLELLSQPDRDHADLVLDCGKGGYVRAIARDLGQMLGSCAHVVQLRRIQSGPFDLESAVSLDGIDAAHLLPVTAALAPMMEVRATAGGAARLTNGNPGEVIARDLAFGEEAWASFDGRPIAIGRYRGGLLHPTRVFRIAPDAAEIAE